MDRDNIDAISEALSDLISKFQNTIEQYFVYQLTQYTDNPSSWKSKQLKESKKFNNAIDKLVEQFKHKINKPIEVAFKEVEKDSKAEIKEIEKEQNEGALILPLHFLQKSNSFKKDFSNELDTLSANVKKGLKGIVTKVGTSVTRMKITSGDLLYNEIDNAMKKGIENVFVTTKSGRKMTFKSYQEMKVRTIMHKEALDYQYESAKKLGVIFYLCSSHADCANDHKDFQGKIYFDKNWKSIIDKKDIDRVQNFITSKKMMSLQDVRDGKPYLTTRPNCRHTFMPITIDQALGNSRNELLEKFGMKKGKYDSKNYKDLQQQRYYERQVRNFKQQSDKIEIEMKNAKDPATVKKLEEKLKLSNSKIRKYQRAVNEVVKSNDVLKRDYRRESYKTIVQDVGHKYNNDKK